MKKQASNARRDIAFLGAVEVTQLHLRSPYAAAWWSAAFPGFGHLLLSKNFPGLVLFIWEIIINMNSQINLSMVYTFTGRFQMSQEVLDTRWMALYIPVYLFAIWNSYQIAVDLNKIYLLAYHEKAPMTNFKITAFEINYIDKREPWIAAVSSFFIPGIGHLYVHKEITAFFILAWWVALAYYSNFYSALEWVFLGDFHKSATMLDAQWMMFMPSIYGFAVYDAYVNAVEGNKLFKDEQRQFLKRTYQQPDFCMPDPGYLGSYQ